MLPTFPAKQIEYHFDMAYCQVGSIKFAVNARARLERRTSNHQMEMYQQHLEAKYVGSRKWKATKLKEEMHMKQEKRDQALTNIYASLGT
jgi:hypothetical protein